MRLKHLFALGLFMVLFFSYCPSSHAYLQKVNFVVFTTNYNDHKEFNVWVEVFGRTSQNPPDFVKSITVTAPDGTIFTMDTVNNWLPYDRAYWGKYFPDDFDSNQIPDGDYTVRVEGLVYGLVINDSDHNDGSVLVTPAFTNLSNEQTNIPRDYIFYWTPVTGATYYRVTLWNEDWGEPVYWFWDKQFRTNHTACMFSNGDLKPNTRYKIRIEARADTQDLDARSRSDWIYFTTSNW